MRFIIKSLSWALAHSPEWIPRTICSLFGFLIFHLSGKRRRLILSNLHHAFPEKSEGWRRRIARVSLQRMVEMFLFPVVAPQMSLDELRNRVTLSDSCREAAQPQSYGRVILVPHFTMTEALTMITLLNPEMPKVGCFFRPLDLEALDRHVREARSRYGITMLSRKEDLFRARDFLKENGWVGVLFDQNAGKPGGLVTCFGRVASATDLPAMLATRYKARPTVIYPRRTGFWRAEMHAEEIPADGTPESIIINAHRWLESYLPRNDERCAEWLWSHARWKTQDEPKYRLRLEQKRNYLEADKRIRGYARMPRKTRIWVRLPNWLGDVVMAVPLIRAIKAGRPDAEITLLAQRKFLPLLDWIALHDRIIPLPEKSGGFDYYSFFRNLREEYPDVCLLFTNSFRGDLEARLTMCPQRFGIERQGKRRPLLTHTWKLPADLDEATLHQTRLWEQYLQHFGLQIPLDLSPIRKQNGGGRKRIGLICGSENAPEKRWPAEKWTDLVNQLAERLPGLSFQLFGTAGDTPISQKVSSGVASARVVDRTGKTNLREFAEELQTCDLIICNDTGGMHLANMFGVPLVAIFGPTNPVRTGPIFDAPATIIQPANAPATGGVAIEAVEPDAVVSKAMDLLSGDTSETRD